MSGFLESGHTKNSSSAGSKACGTLPLSLGSADDRDLDTRRHLRATADDGARVCRSTGTSLPHAPLSMVWQPVTASRRALRQLRPLWAISARPADRPVPAPRCSGNSAPDRRGRALWFRGRSRLLLAAAPLGNSAERDLQPAASGGCSTAFTIYKQNQCLSRGSLNFHQERSQGARKQWPDFTVTHY